MDVIGVLNTRVGCGKSTIACNLSVEAASEGKKVLLIDGDVQASTMTFHATRNKKDNITAVQILTPTISESVQSFTNFDLIVIDAGGKNDNEFMDAMLACNLLIIPTSPSQYDLWACGDTIKVLKHVRTYNKQLSAYFVLNQVIPDVKISNEVEQALKDFSADVKLMNSRLTSLVQFKISVSMGLGVTEYEPDVKASAEMVTLYKEIKGLLDGEG